MEHSLYRIGFCGALSLVLLRLAIGFHFLSAGIEKLDPSFSSAGFLRSAQGPLADFYHSFAPLPHDWDKLAGEPLPPASEFLEERQPATRNAPQGYVPYPTEAYGPWIARVADDWHRALEEFKSLPGVTDEQREAADEVFDKYYQRLAAYVEEHRGEINDYHHELGRLQQMTDSDAAGSLPYLDERIDDKWSEVSATPRPWVADIEAEEALYVRELSGLLDTEQPEVGTVTTRLEEALHPSDTLRLIDTAVTWLTLVVGGCLIAGLCTRVSAVVGAAFLFSILTTQPPWVAGVNDMAKLLFAYQAIELVGLLVLASVGAGAWAGFDGVLWRRSHGRSSTQPDKS